MQLNFKEVNYDGDLEDATCDQLVDLVGKFEDAQDQNAAEFEAAKDEVESLQGEVTEFRDAALGEFDSEDELTGAVAEAGPLGEDELADFSVTRKLDLYDEFSANADADPTDGDDPDGDEGDVTFDDMGNQGETNDDDETETEYDEEVEHLVTSISGVGTDDE
jgi:hypothetical protein